MHRLLILQLYVLIVFHKMQEEFFLWFQYPCKLFLEHRIEC